MFNTHLAIMKKGKIEFIESVNIPDGTKLLITPLPNNENEEDERSWNNMALPALNRAYSDNEPEYSLELVKEFNPEYEGNRRLRQW